LKKARRILFIQTYPLKKLGLKFLKIETDYSSGDTGRIQMRVEALLESIIA
jgi:benzoyl-CoA reductase/2-hydroxyglutaryl-CoA dehydratase subunit BcrC/BadD/HgdB